MAMTFESVRELITKQIKELDTKIVSSEISTKQMKIERRKLKRALQSIGGGDEWQPPTAAMVRPMVLQLLVENASLTEEDIYDLVREKLGEQEVSALGLGLRVDEALAQPEVVAGADGSYSLRSNQKSSVTVTTDVTSDKANGVADRPHRAVLRTVATT